MLSSLPCLVLQLQINTEIMSEAFHPLSSFLSLLCFEPSGASGQLLRLLGLRSDGLKGKCQILIACEPLTLTRADLEQKLFVRFCYNIICAAVQPSVGLLQKYWLRMIKTAKYPDKTSWWTPERSSTINGSCIVEILAAFPQHIHHTLCYRATRSSFTPPLTFSSVLEAAEPLSSLSQASNFVLGGIMGLSVTFLNCFLLYLYLGSKQASFSGRISRNSLAILILF